MSVPTPTTTTEPPSEPAAPSKPKREGRSRASSPSGFVFQITLVIGVALILATLFTAWTPGQTNPKWSDLFPGGLNSTAVPGAQETTLALAVQPSPTFPPGAPTPTLTNPNLIGIVAGHWKHDSGAVCPDGLTEVSINLEIAARVQKQLVEAGYEVDLLAEFDERLNGYQAAALVSIHNDSCEYVNPDATGYKVASALATRHPEQAARLTACLRSRYGSATQLPLHSTSVTVDMTGYHAFSEIHETTPAAIIETGFLNTDRAVLTQKPDVVAFGVASGILCFLENQPLGTPTTLPPTEPAPVGQPAPTQVNMPTQLPSTEPESTAIIP